MKDQSTVRSFQHEPENLVKILKFQPRFIEEIAKLSKKVVKILLIGSVITLY